MPAIDDSVCLERRPHMRQIVDVGLSSGNGGSRQNFDDGSADALPTNGKPARMSGKPQLKF
jgi:hypothetical protein